MNSINKYIDFNKLFWDLYTEQKSVLLEERYQASHFDRLLNFIQHDYKIFDLNIDECSYDGKLINFVFDYDFNDSNESCTQSTTAYYSITYDLILYEFTDCTYEQG